MIFLNGLSSIIECEYLNESLGDKVTQCNILVNPENIKYIVGKIIIINNLEYNYAESIPVLLDNKCKIISRIKLPGFEDKVSLQPYILKICEDVMWNGKIITETCDSLNEILDKGFCEFNTETYKLYFPKVDIKNEKNKFPEYKDSAENLTDFGWVLQQVGVNIKESVFTNLDIYKTGKIIFK